MTFKDGLTVVMRNMGGQKSREQFLSYVTWWTYRIHVDVGIPYDVYWVKIEASSTPEEVQKISAGDLPCPPPESSA